MDGGSLHEEAKPIFQEMKVAGLLWIWLLLDVYGKSGRPKEVMEVLKELELHGLLTHSYNSLISVYARDGTLDEALDFEN